MMRRKSLATALLGVAALLLAGGILWVSFQSAGAQTAPVNNADKVFSHLDTGPFLTCGVSKAGYIRCWGDTFLGPIRSDEAGYI